MTLDEYIASLPKTQSEVKLKILAALWGKGTTFPRGWVLSKDLLKLTGQKYFDRRVRELRDEVGCDVETRSEKGEYLYRLRSTTLTNGNPRSYLNGKQKDGLFAGSQWTCAVCDRMLPAGLRGLQADHKVPLIRGGSSEFSNWQPLCVECNVGKRKACSGCIDDCGTCPWAFPEKIGRRLILEAPADVVAALQVLAARQGKTVPTCVAEAVRDYLERHTR